MIKIIMTKHLVLIKFSLNKDLEGEFKVISFLNSYLSTIWMFNLITWELQLPNFLFIQPIHYFKKSDYLQDTFIK